VPPPYASFDTGWHPSHYLEQYYSAVENDERATIAFLVEATARVGHVSDLLEFGCGPTVHHLFPFADRVDEIHVADYLPSNLDAVRRWVSRQPGAHDWSAFARYSLRCELGRVPTRVEIESREDRTRQRITGFVHADARNPVPIVDERARPRYGAVLCCFCPDSITANRDEWRRCMLNIASLVALNGWLVLAALRATDAYRVGDVRFPSAGVTEHDVAAVLAEAGYPARTTTVTVAQAPDDRGYGFSAITLAMGRRSWT
jgi:hypothetical protein